MSWRDEAACKTTTDIDWFPSFDAMPHHAWKANLERARAVCDGCTGRAECFAEALRDPFSAGIWAGTTESQRNRSPQRPRRVPQVARCGTDAGYRRHRYLGEPICVGCREAHAVATRLKRHMLEVVR